MKSTTKTYQKSTKLVVAPSKKIPAQTGPQPPFPREGLCKECSIEWYVQSGGRVSCYAFMDSGGGYLKKCPVRSCRLIHRIEPGQKMGAIKDGGGSP